MDLNSSFSSRSDTNQPEDNLINHMEKGLMTRDEILEYSEHLKIFAQSLPAQASGASRPASIPQDAIQSLRLWTQSGDSRFLWIEGPGEDPGNEALSELGKQICRSAYEARIPVVSFFRRDHYRPQPQLSTSVQQDGLISLLYSLIQNFINLLPSQFIVTARLARDRFQELDGSFSSVQAALGVLESLMELAPPALICVIDGMERLEDRETMVGIALLVNMLRKQSSGRRFKVLFTTLGRSYVLGKKMEIKERVVASQMRAGSSLPGQASINMLF